MPRHNPRAPNLAGELRERIGQRIERLPLTRAEHDDAKRDGTPRVVHQRLRAAFGSDAGDYEQLVDELDDAIQDMKAIRLLQLSAVLGLPWHPLLPLPPWSPAHPRHPTMTAAEIGEVLHEAIAVQLTLLQLTPKEYEIQDERDSPYRGSDRRLVHRRLGFAYGSVGADSTFVAELTPRGIQRLTAIRLVQFAVVVGAPPHPLIPRPATDESNYAKAVLALDPIWSTSAPAYDNMIGALLEVLETGRSIRDPAVAMQYWTICRSRRPSTKRRPRRPSKRHRQKKTEGEPRPRGRPAAARRQTGKRSRTYEFIAGPPQHNFRRLAAGAGPGQQRQEACASASVGRTPSTRSIALAHIIAPTRKITVSRWACD